MQCFYIAGKLFNDFFVKENITRQTSIAMSEDMDWNKSKSLQEYCSRSKRDL